MWGISRKLVDFTLNDLTSFSQYYAIIFNDTSSTYAYTYYYYNNP